MRVLLGSILTLLVINSCKETNLHDTAPVSLIYRLTDQTGETKSVFSEENQPVFSFLIVNNGVLDLYLIRDNIGSEKFFRVYSSSMKDESGNDVSMGKPYGNHHCEFVNGYLIPAKDTVKIELPWIPLQSDETNYHPILCDFHYDNTPLTDGAYYTGFEVSLNFSNGLEAFGPINESFRINFTVN